MNIFDLIRRIEALEAERDALLVEVAPLRKLRAAKLTPDNTKWRWQPKPKSLVLTMHHIDSRCAASILLRLHRCLFGQP